MKTTVYLELVPERNRFGNLLGVDVGRTWKRRPKPEQVTGGAIVAEIEIEVPTDRLEHVVKAVIPSPQPIAIGRGQ